jgi:adenine-specific DNA-methyltransferase
MRDLLSENGSLFIHLGVQVNHFIRVALEEVFGTENIVDEIIWSYGTPSGGRAAGNKIIKAHEYILYAVKRYGSHTYNKQFLSYSEKYIEERFTFTDEEGADTGFGHVEVARSSGSTLTRARESLFRPFGLILSRRTQCTW